MKTSVTLVSLALLGSSAALAKTDEGDRWRRVSIKAGGGVETYTGDLNAVTSAGPTWGVGLEYRPTSLLGVELAYSGATTEVDGHINAAEAGTSSGPDLVRNGGQAALTLGPNTAIQPYVLAGIGFDRYSARGPSATFSDDTSGAIPLGGGVRANLGPFTADLRANYSVLFSDDFVGVSNASADENSGGRLNATLQLGGRF